MAGPVGLYPTLPQAEALLVHLADQVGIERVPGLSEGVIAIRRGDWQVFLNFNEKETELDLAGDKVIIPGREILVR